MAHLDRRDPHTGADGRDAVGGSGQLIHGDMTGALICTLCTVGFIAFVIGCIVGMIIARKALEEYYL